MLTTRFSCDMPGCTTSIEQRSWGGVLPAGWAERRFVDSANLGDGRTLAQGEHTCIYCPAHASGLNSPLAENVAVALRTYFVAKG